MLWLWPKGGAVALAAFREGVRQPMYWVLTILALLALAATPIIPYFTFEPTEELKMVKEIGYAFTMLFPAIFAVLAASMSISEEIEGRTAVTLMSKPISRRQFLLGKFGGILLAALFMAVLLGWFLVWVVIFKPWWDPPITNEPILDPTWVTDMVRRLPNPELGELVRGLLLWADEAGAALPGLMVSFCQVMVLLAIAVALATRLPMIVNLSICLLIYFLGNLTPILTAVSRQRYALIHFVARLFETLLPGLDLFDVSNAIVRADALNPLEYGVYALSVAFYAVIYTTIALLFGLILFEDRDLA
jgi:ABC-type transport system involved in multi-copper enzyme maturation permease subunit